MDIDHVFFQASVGRAANDRVYTASGEYATEVITSLALVSGGVVMNSMVMELPTEKDGRFWPFVTGAVAYTGLLLLIR